MASTGGKKPRPLPEAFVSGIRELGFRAMAEERYDLPPVYRHPGWPMLFVEAVTMRTPGETRLIARWNGQEVPVPIDPDELIGRLRLQCEAFARVMTRRIR